MDSLKKNKDIYLKIGKNIRKYREGLGISQIDLAGSVHVTKGYISDIECATKGKHPSLRILANIANQFGIDIVELFK